MKSASAFSELNFAHWEALLKPKLWLEEETGSIYDEDYRIWGVSHPPGVGVGREEQLGVGRAMAAGPEALAVLRLAFTSTWELEVQFKEETGLRVRDEDGRDTSHWKAWLAERQRRIHEAAHAVLAKGLAVSTVRCEGCGATRRRYVPPLADLPSGDLTGTKHLTGGCGGTWRPK